MKIYQFRFFNFDFFRQIFRFRQIFGAIFFRSNGFAPQAFDALFQSFEIVFNLSPDFRKTLDRRCVLQKRRAFLFEFCFGFS